MESENPAFEMQPVAGDAPSVRTEILADRTRKMSLELSSPVRKRGLLQDVNIPYITPSLHDIPNLQPPVKFYCPSEPGAVCGVVT